MRCQGHFVTHHLEGLNQFDAAETELAKLPKQWSPVFHADIPDKIAEIRQQIETGRKVAEEKN